jgi:hypothetical protein
MLPEPIEVTIRVTSVLEKLEIPYLIGGSLASTIHGMVRTTQDSDIVASLSPDKIHAFVTELDDEFYIDDQMIVESIKHKSSFNIIHRDTMFKVDIFVPRATPFNKSRFSRAQHHIFSNEPEIRANVSSAEDMVLVKLVWYRFGGELSERQWRDVLGMIKMQGETLDLDYLQIWAQELEVSDLLQRAINDATQ